jgi:hypothetical protein
VKKEQAEKNAKFLANDYQQQLQEILERNPVENLEEIKTNISRGNNKLLLSLVEELLQDFKKFDEKSTNEDKWTVFENSLWREINHFQQTILQHFFAYNLLQTFLVSQYTPLDEIYRKKLLKKHKLTPKKIKDLLLKFLGDKSFLGKIKHGGSRTDFDERKKLQFLGYYNRYLIVIKNARKEKTLLQRKQKKSELAAKREALAKYEIPERLIDSAFSSDAASEVALDWAMESLEISFTREYSKTLLKRRRGDKVIVDADYSIGRRIYAFNRNNKQKADLLRYTPPSQTDYEDWEDPRCFLVEMSM